MTAHGCIMRRLLRKETRWQKYETRKNQLITNEKNKEKYYIGLWKKYVLHTRFNWSNYK